MSSKEMWVANVLDKSGSMASLRDTVITSFNEFLQDRKKDMESGKKVRNWLFTFSNDVKTVINGDPSTKVSKLTEESYLPEGSTALMDAIGRAITVLESEADFLGITPKILVNIFTDGQENSSSKFTTSQIANLISRMQSKGNWTFAFIGSDKDAVLTAKALNIPRGNILRYANTQDGITLANRGVSLSTTQLNTGEAMSTTCLFENTEEDLTIDQAS